MNLSTSAVHGYARGSVIELAARTNTKNKVATELELHHTGSTALRLTGVLQTTLEVDQVVSLFHRELALLVAHDGLTYRHPAHGIEVAVGERGRHSADYRLTINGAELGQLIVSREVRFGEEELRIVEGLMHGLAYPLRNALLYRQALQSALRDPLTGVANRAALDTALEREVALARRKGSDLSLLVLDIDRFKAVNDGHGHAVGDQVLKEVVGRLSATIRRSDLLARFGGEEFVMLASRTPPAGAVAVAERMRRAVAERPCHAEGVSVRVTVSVGAASLAGSDDDARSLFCRADEAVYRAKQAGRDRVVFLSREEQGGSGGHGRA
jgi:diguanylate cyclase (GGDEF)-like protein